MRRAAILTVAVVLVLGLSSGAYAEIFSATENNWSIMVDTQRQIRDGEGTETDGLVNWKDPYGYDYVYQDTWFGRDSTANSESPLSSLNLLSWATPDPNKILLNFQDNASLYLDLSYELHGSGLSSSILERAILTNKGTNSLSNTPILTYAMDIARIMMIMRSVILQA